MTKNTQIEFMLGTPLTFILRYGLNQVYLLEELTPGRELFLFLQRVGRLQEWEAAFYAGGVLLA